MREKCFPNQHKYKHVCLDGLPFYNPLWARLEIFSGGNIYCIPFERFSKDTKHSHPNNWFINQRMKNRLWCCRILLILFSSRPLVDMFTFRNWVVAGTVHDKTAVISYYASFTFWRECRVEGIKEKSIISGPICTRRELEPLSVCMARRDDAIIWVNIC